MDKTIKFNKLAGQAPVLDRVKEELTNFWEKEAQKADPLKNWQGLGMIICFIIFICFKMKFI